MKCEVSGKPICLESAYLRADTKTGYWIVTNEENTGKTGTYSVKLTSLTKTPDNLVIHINELSHQPWFISKTFIKVFERIAKSAKLTRCI